MPNRFWSLRHAAVFLHPEHFPGTGQSTLTSATESQASPNAHVCSHFLAGHLPVSTLVRQKIVLPLWSQKVMMAEFSLGKSWTSDTGPPPLRALSKYTVRYSVEMLSGRFSALMVCVNSRSLAVILNSLTLLSWEHFLTNSLVSVNRRAVWTDCVFLCHYQPRLSLQAEKWAESTPCIWNKTVSGAK